jgi:hypothetical protein
MGQAGDSRFLREIARYRRLEPVRVAMLDGGTFEFESMGAKK